MHEAAAEQASAELGGPRFEAERATSRHWDLADAVAAGLAVA